MAEPRIVAILRKAAPAWMTTPELIAAYCADGAATATAYNAIAQALQKGWIVRTGRKFEYRFRLSSFAPAQVQDGRSRVEERKRLDAAPAGEYRGPVFDRGPLVAALGAPHDPEVMPPEVGRIVDSLHRHFDALFMGVE